MKENATRYSRYPMRRNLLIVALGISFLILMTWAGTVLTSIIPRQPTARVQSAQAGPYQVTVQVNPNPPLITQPAVLSIQIVRSDSQQSVTNAQVTLESSMETMDMGTDRSVARLQNEAYYAQVQFSMSGPWQVKVFVAVPGVKTESATFEITAQ